MNDLSYLDLISKNLQYRELLVHVGRGDRVTCTGILTSASAYLSAAVNNDCKRPVLLLVDTEYRARQIYNELMGWVGDRIVVLHLPGIELSNLDPLTPDKSITHHRVRTLASTLYNVDNTNTVIVASITAMAQRTITVQQYQAITRQIAIGETVDPIELARSCESMGYQNEPLTEEKGAYSRRGGIFDIFPPTADSPFRVEFIGNLIESIRIFDPVTQKSFDATNRVLITPAMEMLPSSVNHRSIETLVKELDTSDCDDVFVRNIHEDINLMMSGHTLKNNGNYAGIFCNGSPMDFLPDNTLLITEKQSQIQEQSDSVDATNLETLNGYVDKHELPHNFPLIQQSCLRIFNSLLNSFQTIDIEPWVSSQNNASHGISLHFDFLPPNAYDGRLDIVRRDIDQWNSENSVVLVISERTPRLIEALNNDKQRSSSIQKMYHSKPAIKIRHGYASEGWILKLDDGAFHVLSDLEIFGKRRPLKPAAKGKSTNIALLEDLEIGNYLVHVDHGIGKFTGITQLQNYAEYLVLDYAENDKLYVPTDQLDRLSTYSAPGNRTPRLTRLGSQEWTNLKERVRKSTEELAATLLELQASREWMDGIAFSPDSPWQLELEDSCPYYETPDQLICISDVKRDMERPEPMDRLICGDVGYGKTEVALRAAFKAVTDGFQVALLVPTTILAEQHYATFCERLASFPVEIEVLSRFRDQQQQMAIIENLRSGKTDICIGTHRMLQNDVFFKELGLIVVDEEQRFGVSAKQRLNTLKKNADMLTLSATPIPRTLHMALSGLRDMSNIQTAPEERLSIKTFVGEYNDQLVRDAILHELDRGGQTFVLHNKVRSIGKYANDIKRLVPEAKVMIGHGQMEESVLESVMSDFANNKGDVLVCTTIIEAGLHIPNANTLIIERADTLGLAQLYQLRGRVGRGSRQGYAYLMFPSNHQLTETGEKRLKAILSAGELGSGFRLAMRDLEIRGAGNILGAEQSGHINSIGYDLYSQLLSEAVKKQRAESFGTQLDIQNDQLLDVRIDLPLNAYIPENYINDLTARLKIYQRLSQFMSIEDLMALSKEIADRFGSIPEPVLALIDLIAIKSLSKQCDIESIAKVNGKIVLQVRQQIGGAKLAIGKVLGETAQVGNNQIRLTFDDQWRKNIIDILKRLWDFQNGIKALIGG